MKSKIKDHDEGHNALGQLFHSFLFFPIPHGARQTVFYTNSVASIYLLLLTYSNILSFDTDFHFNFVFLFRCKSLNSYSPAAYDSPFYVAFVKAIHNSPSEYYLFIVKCSALHIRT